MFVFFAYWFAAIAICSTILLRSVQTYKDKRDKGSYVETRSIQLRKILIIFGVYCLPFLPYLVVAAQTFIFSNQLKPAVIAALNADGDSNDIKDLKILQLWPRTSEVSVITTCNGLDSGQHGLTMMTVTMKYKSSRWVPVENVPDTVWSECGSADGMVINTFPPYFHF